MAENLTLHIKNIIFQPQGPGVVKILLCKTSLRDPV